MGKTIRLYQSYDENLGEDLYLLIENTLFYVSN